MIQVWGSSFSPLFRGRDLVISLPTYLSPYSLHKHWPGVCQAPGVQKKDIETYFLFLEGPQSAEGHSAMSWFM